jgi:hypothetical protein
MASGFTLLTFVTSTLSTSMHDDVEYANRMAIELRARLEPSPTMEPAPRSELKVPNTSESPNTELLIHLQEFAILSRSIYAKATQIRFLIPLATDDPFTEMTKKELIDRFLIDPQKPIYDNFGKILDTYQEVRAYAQDLRARVAFWYGGLAASVLPIDYAFLGAIASSLRRMQIAVQIKTVANFSRSTEQMLVAVAAGTIIGLFWGAVNSPSLLAGAFFAGYFSDL